MRTNKPTSQFKPCAPIQQPSTPSNGKRVLQDVGHYWSTRDIHLDSIASFSALANRAMFAIKFAPFRRFSLLSVSTRHICLTWSVLLFRRIIQRHKCVRCCDDFLKLFSSFRILSSIFTFVNCCKYHSTIFFFGLVECIRISYRTCLVFPSIYSLFILLYKYIGVEDEYHSIM